MSMNNGTSYLEGGQRYAISSQDLKAAFAPNMGGRMLSLRYRDRIDIVVPMEPHRFDILHWPRAGAYPLFPYHNRLADARVSVGDETVHLAGHPGALPHTLHGSSHTRSWHVTRHESGYFGMKLSYRADNDWPWDFTALQEFYVEGATLIATFTMTNESSRPMPGGIGWHPYFASDKQPCTDARFVWPHRDDYLPTGERTPIDDRAAQEMLQTGYLQGWNKVRIACEAGAVTTMRASKEFDYLVVHRGDPVHVCVEPTTHVANAWNLDAKPSSVGARILQPNDVMTGTVHLSVTD